MSQRSEGDGSQFMMCVSLPINRLYFNLLLVCVSLHVATSTAFKSSKLYIFVGIIGGSIICLIDRSCMTFASLFS